MQLHISTATYQINFAIIAIDCTINFFYLIKRSIFTIFT